jgi:hypothetical protein
MAELKPILLVEDNPKDVELTLAALEKSQLANEVIVARDGAEALDYLFSRGPFASRPPGFRPWSCSTSSCRKWTGSRCWPS